MLKMRHLFWIFIVGLVVCLALAPGIARADGGDPTDAGALSTADWFFFLGLIFSGFTLVAFLIAWKLGLFKNTEEAKYYMLTIDEPDYSTPEWAREETDGNPNGDDE